MEDPTDRSPTSNLENLAISLTHEQRAQAGAQAEGLVGGVTGGEPEMPPATVFSETHNPNPKILEG
ncbi:hypothetical protein ACLOJK_001077 [Asimina triloba]